MNLRRPYCDEIFFDKFICFQVQIAANFLVFFKLILPACWKKHLILQVVVSFTKSRSFVFPKLLSDIVQLPKLKLHYWENIKTTVFGPFPDQRVPQLTVPRRKCTDRTILRLLKIHMFNILEIVLEWLCFYFVLNETSDFCNYSYSIHSCDKDSNSKNILALKDNLLLVIFDNH